MNYCNVELLNPTTNNGVWVKARNIILDCFMIPVVGFTASCIKFFTLAGGWIEDLMESYPSTPSTDFASELQPSGSVGTSSIFVVGRWDWHGIVVHGWPHGRQDSGAVDGEAGHSSRNNQD